VKFEDVGHSRSSEYDPPSGANAFQATPEPRGSATPAAVTPSDATVADALRQLYQSYSEVEHRAARDVLGHDTDGLQHIALAYLRNPFLKLTEAESRSLPPKLKPLGIGYLVAARDAATRSVAPRHVVFSMPKSGSSFLSSALQHALDLPRVSLTSFGGGAVSSLFGMNSREQELDEMAMTKAALLFDAGFVAQHHTRYSQYLALQLTHYGLSPLVAVRNTLDCIVSFDDMIKARADHPTAWLYDSQFALPVGYATLGEEARYTLLTHSLGIWLINFYLSWKRCLAQELAAPLVVRYEDHVLRTEALVDHISAHIPMTGEQVDRLRAYADNPDRKRSRFNIGSRGRGEQKLPEHLKQFLSDYARMFAGELTGEDIRYLIG
jgi:hypothetical protein